MDVGFILFAASLGLEINSNHLQITYYAAIICIFLTLGFIYNSIVSKEPETNDSGWLLALLGAVDWPYQRTLTAYTATMDEQDQYPRKVKTISNRWQEGRQVWRSGPGLCLCMELWQGRGTMTLLIPNFYGGASGGEVDHRDSHLAKALINHGAEVGQHLQTYAYWGRPAIYLRSCLSGIHHLFPFLFFHFSL